MKRTSAKKLTARQRRVSLRYAGGDMILIYRLTRKDFKCGHAFLYSLTVTQIGCGGEKRETVTLSDISRNEQEALYIFDTVSRGAVTPCTAAEIVSDLIGIPK